MSDSSSLDVGTVVSLWRYPVKSMMGEELNAAHVTDRGLLGDRVCALYDPSTGKIASAKHPPTSGRSSLRVTPRSSSHRKPACPRRRFGSCFPTATW